MPKNNIYYRKALWHQRLAQELFDVEEYQDAAQLYAESERFYRRAFETPGDRVFFMQMTNLRCLELQLEDRPGLHSQYLTEVRRFLSEWTPPAIVDRITEGRREEALYFRSWRSDALTTSNVFSSVNAEVKKGNYEGAQSQLDDLIQSISQTQTAEKDALLALARSRKAMIPALAELEKRRFNRDLIKVADSYLQATRALSLPWRSRSKQKHRISALRCVYFSLARKYRAVAAQVELKKSQGSVYKLLKKAHHHYHHALKFAKLAKQKSPESISLLHIQRLTYSFAISEVRLSLMEMMQGGERRAFLRAIEAWRTAFRTAKEACIKKSLDNTSESADESINEFLMFPNRYYSLNDLRLEEYFINAAHAFRQRDWLGCVSNLEHWLSESANDYKWSWRYSNVYVRLLGTRVISLLEQQNKSSLTAAIHDLRKLIKSEPVGDAASSFAREAEALVEKSQDKQAWRASLSTLNRLFPLDAQTTVSVSLEKKELLASLPSRLYRSFSLPPPMTPHELELYRSTFLGALESFLGYIQDYDAAWAKGKSVPPDEGWRVLLQRCRKFDWAQGEQTIYMLDQLEEETLKLESTKDSKTFSEAYEKAVHLVRKFVPFMPLIVQIDEALRLDSQNRRVSVMALWGEDNISRSGFYERNLTVEVESDKDFPIEPGLYYLPPPWRTGTRMLYKVNSDDHRPLHSVRFRHRWEYWEMRRRESIISDVRRRGSIISDVPYEFLERAIELAARSESEDDKPRPKVGAVIIKGGRIISEGYRNQDGQGSHAEQIAFQKSGKQDLSGATIITTLEPCTRGRSNQNTPCTMLIIFNDIKRVVWGLLDPNPDITGTAEFLLRENGISVSRFPDELLKKLEEIDSEFREHHLKQRGTRTITLLDPQSENS